MPILIQLFQLLQQRLLAMILAALLCICGILTVMNQREAARENRMQPPPRISDRDSAMTAQKPFSPMALP
jgi:hypothetical protein